MKACLILLVLVGTVVPASADVFVFKDLDGFEQCMQTDHLVEQVKTDTGSQTRLLTQEEIQVRCVATGAKLLAGTKNKDQGLAFVKSTKRLSAPELSLDLIGPLADYAIAACNEMAVYEVILRGLGRSRDGNPIYAKTRNIVKRCLKDGEFKKDFLEEKDSGDAQVADNACQILLEEKLVKACKGSK
ncbi:MAG TPA: hypothetical protein VH165_01105 [Kofleriaceae bacterium]|nr:hypothetical protein [Kofleriaceae bacterium]